MPLQPIIKTDDLTLKDTVLDDDYIIGVDLAEPDETKATFKAKAVNVRGKDVLTIQTITEMQGREGSYDGQSAFLNGYHVAGDKGAGQFYWDASYVHLVTDINGMIVYVAGVSVGAWIRIHNGTILAAYCGADPSFTDNRTYIQNAIDFAPEVLVIDDEYVVSIDPDSPEVANAYTAASVCLNLSSPIKISGKGKLKLKDGEGVGVGTGAIIGNAYITTINGQIEIDVEIDGNESNTFGEMSGVLLVGTSHVIVRPGCYVHDVTRHGVMVRPNPSQSGETDTIFEVDYPTINNCGSIGIQATRVKEFLHYGSKVTNCVDNAIDAYGNDGNGSGLDSGFIGKAIIRNAIVDTALTGIFIESFSDWQITEFDLRNCNGIKANRITTGAYEGRINSGKIKKVEGSIGYGIKFESPSGYSSIDNVQFDGMEYSIHLRKDIDRVLIGSGNTHRRISKYLVFIDPTSPTSLVKSTIRDQYIYEEGLTVAGYPQLTPPLDHPDYNSLTFNVGRGNLRSIAGDVLRFNDFTESESVLTSPGSWGGAYSLYNIGSDGETRINTSPDISIPKYVTISGVAYYLVSSGTGGEYYVRQWDGTTATAGDYTGVLNSALTVEVKYDEFSVI